MVLNICQVLLSILHPVDAYSPQPYDVGVRIIPFFTGEMCKGISQEQAPTKSQMSGSELSLCASGTLAPDHDTTHIYRGFTVTVFFNQPIVA